MCLCEWLSGHGVCVFVRECLCVCKYLCVHGCVCVSLCAFVCIYMYVCESRVYMRACKYSRPPTWGGAGAAGVVTHVELTAAAAAARVGLPGLVLAGEVGGTLKQAVHGVYLLCSRGSGQFSRHHNEPEVEKKRKKQQKLQVSVSINCDLCLCGVLVSGWDRWPPLSFRPPSLSNCRFIQNDGSRFIRVWIIQIPGQFKVLRKSHVDLSCANLLVKSEICLNQ